MKKILVSVVIAAISVWNGGFVFASSLLAVDQTLTEQGTESDYSSQFVKFSGVISEVNQTEKSFILKVENEEAFLTILDETLLFNATTTEKIEKQTLEKGMKIDAYYDKNKPMIMIYPPRITPEIVVVNDLGMGQVKISKFDENFISADHELKLKLSENTVLINEQGEPIEKEDLHGKELVVFYDVSTKSIPAQTTPKKIIALGYESMDGVEKLIHDDHYIKDGVTMIPIRKVAEQLGYEVKWQHETSSFNVSKGNSSFHLKIDEKVYKYNDIKRNLNIAPELKSGKTYVPNTLLKSLLEN